MGYYIFLEQSTAVLPQEHQAEAYERMCALNDTDEGKTGGNGEKKWFAWMDPNYPETCVDAKAILVDLGFFFDVNEDGDLLFTEYDSKMGSEAEFLRCIGDLLTGEMVWRGEEHNLWRYTFGSLFAEGKRQDRKMRVHEPVERDIEWEQVPFFKDERFAVANSKPWR